MKDLCGMFLAAIEYPELAGIYNACSPDPVMNQDFMSELRAALKRPWSPPVPAFAVRIGSWLMGSEGKLALGGQRVLPEHFLKQDFPFEFPTLKPTLKDLLSQQANRRSSG
jgi:NAD dependent epimerase/dehydratase family enzyme